MAGISDSTREQIRAANDIIEVIGAVVPLKRAGTNFVGLCPFHREKSPSFNVSPAKQMYKCFGCGKGGDVFRFLMDYENIPFPDAMRRLAERAHIVIQEDNFPGSGETRAIKDKLLTVHEQITQRWQTALNSDPGAQIARDYLAKRRVDDESVKLFRIGYAPDAWDDTVNWARGKGFEPELMETAGLIIRKDAGGHYDRFRGRLMFPICDEQGRVVAFSGRVLSGDEKIAKYVNSPETPIFTKGRLIFGLDKAKRAILDRQVAVVCEGQLDMIACYGAGVQNTVAPQGTAFTGDQARLLKRYTKEVVLCFDSDNAGLKAAVRALDDLIQSGLAIRVAQIPAPHDPDSFIKEFGAAAFTQLIEKAVGFFDFYLDLLCKQNDVRTDRGQREVAISMSTALTKTGDPHLFERYARKAGQVLGLGAINVVEGFRQLAKQARKSPRQESQADDALPQEEPEIERPKPSQPELWILKLALLNDDHLEWLAAHLDFHWLEHPDVRAILEHRLSPRDDGSWTAPADLLHSIEDPHTQNLLTQESTEALKIADPFKLLSDTLLRLRNLYIDRQLNQIGGRMADAQANIAELMAQQRALRAARSAPLTPISDTAEF